MIEAKGPAGSAGTLFVSAPGMPETQVSIRVVEKVLVTQTPDVRLTLTPDRPESQGELSYSLAAHDPGAGPTGGTWLLTTYFADLGAQKVRVTADPPGVCELPSEVAGGQFPLSIPFKCRQ